MGCGYNIFSLNLQKCIQIIYTLSLNELRLHPTLVILLFNQVTDTYTKCSKKTSNNNFRIFIKECILSLSRVQSVK